MWVIYTFECQIETVKDTMEHAYEWPTGVICNTLTFCLSCRVTEKSHNQNIIILTHMTHDGKQLQWNELKKIILSSGEWEWSGDRVQINHSCLCIVLQLLCLMLTRTHLFRGIVCSIFHFLQVTSIIEYTANSQTHTTISQVKNVRK